MLELKQLRKGTAIPYVAHLLAVVSVVLEDGGDEDQTPLCSMMPSRIRGAGYARGDPNALR